MRNTVVCASNLLLKRHCTSWCLQHKNITYQILVDGSNACHLHVTLYIALASLVDVIIIVTGVNGARTTVPAVLHIIHRMNGLGPYRGSSIFPVRQIMMCSYLLGGTAERERIWDNIYILCRRVARIYETF